MGQVRQVLSVVALSDRLTAPLEGFLQRAVVAFPTDLGVLLSVSGLFVKHADGRAERFGSMLAEEAERVAGRSEPKQAPVLLKVGKRLASFEGVEDGLVQRLFRASLEGAVRSGNVVTAVMAARAVDRLSEIERLQVESLVRRCQNPRVLAQLLNLESPRDPVGTQAGLEVTRFADETARAFFERYEGETDLPELNALVGTLLKRDAVLALDFAARAPGPGLFHNLALAQLARQTFDGQSESATATLRAMVLENPADNQTWTYLRFAAVRAEGPNERDIHHYYSLKPPLTRGVPDWVTSARRVLGALGDSRPHSSLSLSAQRQFTEPFGEKYLPDYKKMSISDLRDKSVLAVADLGVSDEVRHLAVLTWLTDLAGEVILTCDPRFETIIRRSFVGIKVVPHLRFIQARERAKEHKVSSGLNRSLVHWRERALPDLTELSNFCPDVVVRQSTLMDFAGRQKIDKRHSKNQYLNPNPMPLILSNKKSAPVAKLRVGLQWRSNLRSGTRAFMYPDVKDLAGLLDVPGVEYVSLQHGLDAEEELFLGSHKVHIPQIDLHNDFESIASLAASLDLVVGTSSLPIELAAAVGTEVWMLGFIPENYYWRTCGGNSTQDILTWNSTVIGPNNPRAAFRRGDREALFDTVTVVRQLLERRTRDVAS